MFLPCQLHCLTLCVEKMEFTATIKHFSISWLRMLHNILRSHNGSFILQNPLHSNIKLKIKVFTFLFRTGPKTHLSLPFKLRHSSSLAKFSKLYKFIHLFDVCYGNGIRDHWDLKHDIDLIMAYSCCNWVLLWYC